MFTKSMCPYCKKARALFDGMKQSYFAFEIDKNENGEQVKEELKKMTGQSSVPNIFINGNHIGGSDKLLQLNESGKLKDLLA